MGADTITVTDQQINRSLRGILIQLGASGIAKNYDSLSDAIEKLDLWDFLYNEAEVVACLHEWNRFYMNLNRRE